MKIIIAAMLLSGCAAEPLTYEQQLAIAQMGQGLSNAGAAYSNSVPEPASPYQVYGPLPQFNKPFDFNRSSGIAPIRY